MAENRKLKRWHLIYYLRVFDQDSDSLLGHLVDITTEGVKMVSEIPIPTEKDFRLRMEVPLESSKAEEVMFEAHSLWCRRDTNPDFFAAGFRLVNPKRTVVNLIRGLISELSFND